MLRRAEVAHQLSHTPQVDSIFNVPAGKDNLYIATLGVNVRICRRQGQVPLYDGHWHTLRAAVPVVRSQLRPMMTYDCGRQWTSIVYHCVEVDYEAVC